MPQGRNKTGEEDVEFQVMLPTINLLYLFCGVLVLLDLSYMSRFWVRCGRSNSQISDGTRVRTRC